MSSRVMRSAVAVSAITGMLGKRCLRVPSWVYSGRKSCPHCEMQCASSTANMQMRSVMLLDQRSISLSSFSGEMYSSLTLPCMSSSRVWRFSVSLFSLFSARAGTPFCCKASIWSFINANRGEMTMTNPSSLIRPGIWKHNDLPPPVGMSTMLSPPSSAWSMISHC